MRNPIRSGNPVFRTGAFSGQAVIGAGGAMTMRGTVNRAIILLVLLLISAGWCWNVFLGAQGPQALTPYLIGGVIGGLVFALASIFKPQWTPVTAPLYAICEGLVLGGLSGIFEMQYPGIVLQAVGLTLGTALAMLVLYRSGVIRVTHKFRMGVMAATGGIFLFYLASMLLGFFGVNMSVVWGGGPIGIGISLVVVTVAALNLVLDFDLIDRGVSQGMPKYGEWYGAFALMVTLVWLYLEMLRLLARLRE